MKILFFSKEKQNVHLEKVRSAILKYYLYGKNRNEVESAIIDAENRGYTFSEIERAIKKGHADWYRKIK